MPIRHKITRRTAIRNLRKVIGESFVWDREIDGVRFKTVHGDFFIGTNQEDVDDFADGIFFMVMQATFGFGTSGLFPGMPPVKITEDARCNPTPAAASPASASDSNGKSC